MSPELVAILAAAVTLAGLILNGQYSLRRDIADVRTQIVELRERMARLEGLFEGFIAREHRPGAA